MAGKKKEDVSETIEEEETKELDLTITQLEGCLLYTSDAADE